MSNLYGLIGEKLEHSFSKEYFITKFRQENIADSDYRLFELTSISELPGLLKNNPTLKGLNVTIPYKRQVIPFLHDLDDSAQKVGAVNVLKPTSNGLMGYNSDYYGFHESLKNWIGPNMVEHTQALVLGTGGAAQAVCAVLDDLNISKHSVSRKSGDEYYDYDGLTEEIMMESKLIINTTPVGMYPDVDDRPSIPYQYLTESHWLFDLVYNPELTSFLQIGREYGANIKNGLEMLQLQAEKSWKIWNS